MNWLRTMDLLTVLFQKLHPPVSGDSVRNVDDQLSLAQLEEAVDGLAQPPARGPAQVGPPEQLAAGDQDDAVRHQPETPVQVADGEMKAPLSGQPRGAEDLAQPPDLGLRLADGSRTRQVYRTYGLRRNADIPCVLPRISLDKMVPISPLLGYPVPSNTWDLSSSASHTLHPQTGCEGFSCYLISK